MPENKVFIHLGSGSYYKVTRQEGFSVYYERLGDGKAYSLSLPEFAQRMRPATEEEVERLEEALPTLQAAGKKATLETVEAALSGKGGSGVGFLFEPTEEYDFKRMVISDEIVSSIQMGLNKIKRHEDIQKVWNITRKQDKRLILNFYGPPGTGKTMAARCIAKEMGKNLYQVDYSQMISKWVGETAKHIKAAFAEAAKADAILFWDEADSLMSKRLTNMEESHANSVNQNRNVLMQEMDKFNNPVIMTTNLFSNYDEALLRRIAQHVEFKLPTLEQRVKLIDLHMPKTDRIQGVDTQALAKASDGFSGGDILNLCENSVDRASLDPDTSKWYLTQELMLSEVKKIGEAKKQHAGKGGAKSRKPLGFMAPIEG